MAGKIQAKIEERRWVAGIEVSDDGVITVTLGDGWFFAGGNDHPVREYTRIADVERDTRRHNVFQEYIKLYYH